jgi:asparagine synthase (glutamine-hydrolysing)
VGEGADELFCGYPYWAKLLAAQSWARTYQRVPGALRRAAAGSIAALPLPWSAMRPLEIFRRASADEPLFWGGAEAYQETHKSRFLSRSFRARLNGYSSAEPIHALRRDFESDAPDGADDLHWMTYLDLRLRLPELLLMRVDKMTMATSVEARVPFLDQEFVKLAMGIPSAVKFKDNVLKYLLKKAVEPLLPREVIHRPKQGFAVPVADWFQAALRTWADDKIRGFVKRTDYFDRESMESFLRDSSAKKTWFLLNFVLWHEAWIEQRPLDLPLN